jgi:RHS repeat-associated protein
MVPIKILKKYGVHLITNSNMKKFPLFIFLLSIVQFTVLKAQNIGGHGNGQSSPAEVKASELTKGAYTADVNLFTGALSSSYSLGSVSTPSGLSFSLSLNYSSSFSGGNDVPLVNGVPYGEGWSLNLPTINITTQAYNKYDRAEMAYNNSASGDGNYSSYSSSEAGQEGDPFWFGPEINIPGVISERFIYKYTEGGGDGDMVFVPYKFDSYVEARLHGNLWKVILADGTVYEFGIATVGYRNPSNQRYIVQNSGIQDSYGEYIPNMPLSSTYTPKGEILSWAVTKIYHPNYPNNQKIVFAYENFGAFDYYREFQQEKFLYASQTIGYNFTAYKDLILKEVISAEDYGAEFIEKIVLGYRTQNFEGTPDEMLLPWEDDVYRKDSLYNYISVYAKGIETGEQSFFGTSPVNSSFSNWLRYHHVRSTEAHLSGPAFCDLTNTNPYVYIAAGACSNPDGGLMTSSHTNENLIRNKASASAADDLSFNHCFLESELLDPNSGDANLHLIAGDVYELRTYISKSSLSPTDFCNFDVAVVAGDNSTTDTPPTSISSVAYNTYKKHRDLDVFSTFNRPVKWNLTGSSATSVVTSNFFSLSNLPDDFGGIRIQVGPANSDHDFGQYGTVGADIADNTTTSTVPNSYKAYRNFKNGMTVPSEALYEQGCGPMPDNFGIGLEWHMMRKIYSDMLDQTYNASSSRYKFWWKLDPSGSGAPYWDNVPTAADDEVYLNAVELIRYSKNPYMLNYVRTYRCNGADATTGNSKKIMTSMLKLDYKVVMDTVKDNYDPNEGTPTGGDYGSLSHHKYIYLLKKISEIPVNSTEENAALSSYDTTKAPTTHYEYTKLNMNFYAANQVNFNYNTLDDSGNRINANTYPLTKITDRLGGETTYSYYRPSEQMLINNYYQWSPANNDFTSPSSAAGEIKMANPTAITFSLCVKKKTVTDATGSSIPKEWLYSYETPVSVETTPDALPYVTSPTAKSHFYIESNKTEHGFTKTIVKEPLIDSNPNPIRTEYTHFTTEYNYMLFGKLKQSIAYDAGNHKIEKKEFKYKVRQAYMNGLLRSSNFTAANYSNTEPLVYYSDPLGEYDQFATIAYNAPPGYLTSPVMGGSFLSMTMLEAVSPTLFSSRFLSSYFIPLVKEITTSYDHFIPGSVVAIASPAVAPVPVGSTKMMTSSIASSSLTSSSLGAIFIGQDSLKSITDYEYWDADSIGETESNGYLVLNGSITDGAEHLHFEPSWELYKKKTYSPQLPDAYSMEENFYFFDMKNFINNPSNVDTLMNLYGLNWSSRYHMRNIPYETRTTTKTQGKDAISKSVYYWYDARFETTEDDDLDETIHYDGTEESCDAIDPPRSYTGSLTPPETDCLDPDTLSYYPPPGYRHRIDSLGNHWWCPYTLNDYTSETYQLRIPYFVRNLKNKLFLRYTKQQVDILLTDDANYDDPGSGKILRFALLSDNVHHPIFPFRSHQNYYVEARNIYGQVKLETDTKGLKTFYYYDSRYDIEFIDDNSICATHTITTYPNIGLPHAVTVGYSLTDSLRTEYQFNKDHSVSTLTDPNGLAMEYEYDEFARLKNTTRNGQLLSVINYHNWENTFIQSFVERAEENYVETYTLNDIGSTIAERSRAYVDPQGRKYDILTQVSPDYTDPAAYDTKMIHSGLTTFDNWNRTVAQYKPFKTGDGISSELFTPDLTAGSDKTEQQYENTQRSKVLRASKFGENIATGHTVNSSYKIIRGTSLITELGLNSTEQGLMLPGGASYYRFLKTSAIDEDGKKVITYTDAIGRQVATKTYITYSNAAVTLFIYNSMGQQELVINPLKQESTYEFNLLGQLYRKTNVDGGEVRYMYNESGQVVLEEDANARAGTDWSGPFMRRYHYDDFGRMTKQERVTFTGSAFQHPFYWQNYDDPGVDRLTFSYATTTDYEFNLQHNAGGTPLPDDWQDVSPYAYINSAAVEKELSYHNPVVPTDPLYLAAASSVTAYLGTYSQDNLAGKMSTSISYNNTGTPIEYKVYSYNDEGLPSYEINQFVKSSVIIPSVITYPLYNLRGTLQEQHVDGGIDGTDEMEYHYNFDGWNRLVQVTADDGSLPDYTVADYIYDDALGLLTASELTINGTSCTQTADNVDYTYDVRDRLTSINSRFFEEYLYYDGGSNRHPQLADTSFKVQAGEYYNGNINATKVKYKLNTASNYTTIGSIMDEPAYYGYKYDGMNRLDFSDASIMNRLSGSPSVSNVKRHYGDEGYRYDKIGNILNLDRGYYYAPSVSSPADASDHWRYVYSTGTNKLDNIMLYGTTTVLRNYTYDNSGNMKTDDFKDIASTTYGRANLPSNLTVNGDAILYLYNANDNRIYKENDAADKEYYLQDASGRTVGIYNVSGTNWTWYAYGKDRIAKFGSGREFFEYDHLGNTRVTFSASVNCVTPSTSFTINNAIDYYPYGKVLRSYNGSQTEKFLFTSKERDQETELDYFEARFLDSDIGRFLETDPNSEDYSNLSPYNYVAGNPISRVDPDGRNWWDKIVGVIMGMATDVAPISTDPNVNLGVSTLIRNVYTPTDADDYNQALEDTDEIMILAGKMEIGAGAGAVGAGLTMETGGGGATMTVVGAPVGVPVAVVGAVAVGVGTLAATTGTATVSNAEANKKATYNYGKATGPYQRPSNATNKAQKASVQNKPCVDCGKRMKKMYADHKTPLVKEWYKTGKIDKSKMRALKSVQPHCSTCSAKQGGKLSAYSKQQKKLLHDR